MIDLFFASNCVVVERYYRWFYHYKSKEVHLRKVNKPITLVFSAGKPSDEVKWAINDIKTGPNKIGGALILTFEVLIPEKINFVGPFTSSYEYNVEDHIRL